MELGPEDVSLLEKWSWDLKMCRGVLTSEGVMYIQASYGVVT